MKLETNPQQNPRLKRQWNQMIVSSNWGMHEDVSIIERAALSTPEEEVAIAVSSRSERC